MKLRKRFQEFQNFHTTVKISEIFNETKDEAKNSALKSKPAPELNFRCFLKVLKEKIQL